MSEALLIFRWNSQKYGVSVDDVAGFIKGTRIGSAENSEKACDQHSQLNPALIVNRENNQTIFLHSNGVHMHLAVDQVSGVLPLEEKVGSQGFRQANFRIWRIDDEIER